MIMIKIIIVCYRLTALLLCNVSSQLLSSCVSLGCYLFLSTRVCTILHEVSSPRQKSVMQTLGVAPPCSQASTALLAFLPRLLLRPEKGCSRTVGTLGKRGIMNCIKFLHIYFKPIYIEIMLSEYSR